MFDVCGCVVWGVKCGCAHWSGRVGRLHRTAAAQDEFAVRWKLLVMVGLLGFCNFGLGCVRLWVCILEGLAV